MKTIYIKGRGQYKKNLRRAINKSDLKEGFDYVEGTSTASYVLIWIREEMTLRELKKSITAKYVWKNRLKFFESYQEMNPKQHQLLNETVIE